METNDQRPLHRQALDLASGYVSRIGAADLDRPTPCTDWDLGALLAHMVGQHVGFAAAIRDGDAPRERYAPVPFDQPAWQASVDQLLEAFATADLSASVLEVELHPTKALPVPTVIGAQLLDTVVHTWDVARGMGEQFTPGEELVQAVLAIAEQIPDNEQREAPGAAFARAVPSPGAPWERALALLGRDLAA